MTWDDQSVVRVTKGVLQRCDELGRVSDEAGGITRLFLSPATKRAQGLVRRWMGEAGMSVRVDGVGNVIGTTGVRGKKILVGSHLDTVPNAGKFDGILGVMVGIAAVELLREKGVSVPVDVIGFSEEEGVRFGRPYLGSKAVVGELGEEMLRLTDREGRTVAEAIEAFGLDARAIGEAAYRREEVAGYVEVHIEQGPVLEATNHPLGVVTAIAGQTRQRVTFTGCAGHAGTCPMDRRLDALAGAAEFVLEVERVGRRTEGLVATVGRAEVRPNASNVVPGEVTVSLDVRHEEDGMMETAVQELTLAAGVIAGERGLGLAFDGVSVHPAVPMDAGLVEVLSACAGEGAPRVVSGAGHDAAVMARWCPAAMLFVRSPKGGLSHHPDEAVYAADVARAVRVLAEFLCRVGGEYDR